MTEPRTEAGRRLWSEPWWSARYSPDPTFIRDAILAIEAEALALLEAEGGDDRLRTANQRLREAINFSAIPTLLIFAEKNAGVREVIGALREALAASDAGSDGLDVLRERLHAIFERELPNGCDHHADERGYSAQCEDEAGAALADKDSGR